MFLNSVFMSEYQHDVQNGHRLLTVLSIPKTDYNSYEVWSAIRLGHSSLRGTDLTNQLSYFGTKLGGRCELGICLTTQDFVNEELHKGGSVYVNR